MRSPLNHLPIAMALALSFALAAPADAQVRFGVRAGEYTDVSEPFLGLELLTPLSPRWYFNPNVEFVFVDDGDLVTLNGDINYDLDDIRILMPWVGGGLAVIWEDIGSESDTSLGGNVIAGVGFRTNTSVIPYVQVKGIIGSDAEGFVVMGGVRF